MMGGKLSRGDQENNMTDRKSSAIIINQNLAPVDELLTALLGDNAVRDGKVLQLLESSNPNMTLDGAGLKPIHIAVLHQNLELLQRLLSNRDIDVNVRTAGLTPLHFAAQVLSVEAVQELLKQPNILVNAVTIEEKQTAIMIAIASTTSGTDEEKANVVQCLVEDERCQLDKSDADGWIALTYAARHGNVPVGIVLLSDQRSQSYTVNQLVNAYRQAILGGHEGFCELLMETLTSSQKEHIRGQVNKLKELEGTTPILREMLHQAVNLLDSGYVEEVPSGPAWDKNGQLLQTGSVVELLKNKAEIRALQKGIGKHLDGLDNVSGQIGLVKHIDLEGVVSVDFTYFVSPHKRLRLINPKALIRLSQDYIGIDTEGNIIQANDTVRLAKEVNSLAVLASHIIPPYPALQQNAEQTPDISNYAGQVGTLKYFDQKCHPVVVVAGNIWTLDAGAISKVVSVLDSMGQSIEVGDTVEISPSKAVLEHLQTPLYGDWNANMLGALGKRGIVVRIGCQCFIKDTVPDCTVTVVCNKTEWIFNPKAVKFIQRKVSPPTRPNRKWDNGLVPPKQSVPASPVLEKELMVSPMLDQDQQVKSTPPSQSGSNTSLKIFPDIEKFVKMKDEDKPSDQLVSSPDKIQPEAAVSSLSITKTDKKSTLKRSKKYIIFEELKFGEKLGKGGFGTVYRARWHGCQCAVKVIKCDETGTEDISHPKDVLAEAELHGSISHPHIVQFLGMSFNESDKLNLNAYIILKFVDGYNLHQCIFGYKMHFTGEEKVTIAQQVCSAIRYLHDDANIIHQDIKPHNIMIDKQTHEALVTDFGISRIFSDPQLDFGQSSTMAMYTQRAYGSVPYMAPELVILSKRKSLYRKPTPASDIWSLAGTLTEMFTGRSLYSLPNGPDLQTLLNLKAAMELPAGIVRASKPVRVVFETSLSSAPELRPNCRELLGLLEMYEDDLKVQTTESEV